MSSPTPIDFWFSMGSTYTYLAVMRIEALQRSMNITFHWRPFHLLTILNEMRHVPFADKPAKALYMWRDIERRAAMHGLPVRVPAPYPAKQSVVANRVALLGLQEGWGRDFVKAAYRNWFQAGLETGEKVNLSASLGEIGQDPVRVLKRSEEADVQDLLARETNEARALGIFGSPTFAVAGELFWGDDRLEDAISWQQYGRVLRS